MDDVKCKRMSRKRERNFTHKILLSERTCNFHCWCSSVWMKNLHFFLRAHNRWICEICLTLSFFWIARLFSSCAQFSLCLAKIFKIQPFTICQIKIDTFQILCYNYLPARWKRARFDLGNLHEKLHSMQLEMLQILEILQTFKLYSKAACSEKFSRKTRHYNEFHVERKKVPPSPAKCNSPWKVNKFPLHERGLKWVEAEGARSQASTRAMFSLYLRLHDD